MLKRSGKELAMDLLCDFVGAFLFDVGIYNFALNAEFAPVGVSGLALIFNYLFGLPMGVMSILLNIPIILVSYKILGKRFLAYSIKTMLIFSLVLDLVVPYLPVYNGQPLVAAICTGVLSGLGLVIIYMRGASTGGTDFLVMAVRKLMPHLTIGQITLAVDGAVIVLGGIVFKNVDAVIMGLIATMATTVVIDKVMYGLGGGKLVFIVTDNEVELARRIEERTGRGCTFLNAQGSYQLSDKRVVMCACNNSQVVPIKKVLHELDPSAFMVIADSNEVIGEGFKKIEEAF